MVASLSPSQCYNDSISHAAFVKDTQLYVLRTWLAMILSRFIVAFYYISVPRDVNL